MYSIYSNLENKKRRYLNEKFQIDFKWNENWYENKWTDKNYEIKSCLTVRIKEKYNGNLQ